MFGASSKTLTVEDEKGGVSGEESDEEEYSDEEGEEEEDEDEQDEEGEDEEDEEDEGDEDEGGEADGADIPKDATNTGRTTTAKSCAPFLLPPNRDAKMSQTAIPILAKTTLTRKIGGYDLVVKMKITFQATKTKLSQKEKKGSRYLSGSKTSPNELKNPPPFLENHE